MKLDVPGEICPYPQVKTVAALKTGAERPTRGAH
jgi:TusA-related sulfurtransferase